ncbi:splicing factor U2af large subunit B-like isoform X2 [Solanum stenotomum]|uniref:splicing factor U2af large subunit B-like isoform X2 n=1 Tax=Solanum stenotomum TaxID=172797 RepID=UPI0020D19610|nr:splicing factor U2af large subunit B-like isoform X2 [Solanum stenotomum]
MSSPELVSTYFFACCFGLISEYCLIGLLQSQSNGSQHYRVKANGSGDQDHHRHREEYKDKNTRSYRRNDDNEDYSRSRNHKFDRRQDRGGREKGETRRSRSRSKDWSHDKARSRSSSPLPPKSKRTSGFDMAPPVAASFSSGAEQFLCSSNGHPSIPGILQNVFPTDATQVNPLGSFPFLPVQAMSQQATRHARRVYVGGLPPLANEQTISAFFSHVMIAVGGNSAGPGDAVVNVYINHEKKFAFVEMRTVEEASNAMALDGVVFEGVSVRIRRPTDYNPSLAAALGPGHPSPHLNLAAAGLMPGATGDAEDQDRIFIGGLPYLFTEVQIKELLESFGPLRRFEVVKDRDTGNSKGYGFCTYQNPLDTDMACASLNGLKMGDKTLTVRRATSSGQVKSEQECILAQARQHIAMQKMAFEASGMTIPGTEIGPVVTAEIPTKVLCLTEVITPQELFDDVEYGEILEDMKEEGQKFGDLIDVVIPRPEPDQKMVDGFGKVFLEYSDTIGCTKAKAALGGRKFGGNTAVAIFYPEDKYYKKDYAS